MILSSSSPPPGPPRSGPGPGAGRAHAQGRCGPRRETPRAPGRRGRSAARVRPSPHGWPPPGPGPRSAAGCPRTVPPPSPPHAAAQLAITAGKAVAASARDPASAGCRLCSNCSTNGPEPRTRSSNAHPSRPRRRAARPSQPPALRRSPPPWRSGRRPKGMPSATNCRYRRRAGRPGRP